jgi:peptidoglycan/xylan/chitin deacetylase (PgdA/CDA1 family)
MALRLTVLALLVAGCAADNQPAWNAVSPTASDRAAGATRDPTPTPPTKTPGTKTPDPTGSAKPTPPPAPRPRTGPFGTTRVTGVRAVALTFDDGPHATWTPKVLDLLKAQGVKATFCLIGEQVREYRALVARIVREGHTLCNHSWDHDLRLGKKSGAQIRADLERTNREIRRAVPGAKIPYYRQPGGEWTPSVVRVAKDLGMKPLHWDVDPRDWARPGGSQDQATRHLPGPRRLDRADARRRRRPRRHAHRLPGRHSQPQAAVRHRPAEVTAPAGSARHAGWTRLTCGFVVDHAGTGTGLAAWLTITYAFEASGGPGGEHSRLSCRVQ